MKDIFRRRTKLLVGVLGVVIAASAIVAVITTFTAATDSLYDESGKFGANIIIRPQTNSIPLIEGSTMVGSISTGENYIDESKLPNIYTIENSANLAVVSPRLYGIANIGISSSSPVILMGVDPKEEPKIKAWWKLDGRWISAEDGERTEVMLGSDIAKPLGLVTGSTITLTNGNNSVDGDVVAVIETTGGSEDGYIITSLKTAQYLFDNEGKISSIEVRALCNDCPVEEMSRQIETALPNVEARAMSQIVLSEMALIKRTQSSAMAVSIITLLVSALTVASTMLASVNEKLKEIGIMRAVGASDIQIVSMLLFEGAIIGAIGGSVGFVLGTLVSFVAAPLLLSVTPSPIWILLPAAAGVSITVGMVASVIPVKRAVSIDPAEVLRSV
ncbi:MAG: putative ABC transport system permease protein [Candidatus Methanocomedens sp.]|nr:MAG: putative ABC transport system permease protein [ANME-2 cluster archaeon]